MRARELRREDGAAGEERRGIEEERGRGIDQEDRTRRRRKLTMTRSTPLSRYGCNTVYQVMCVRRE